MLLKDGVSRASDVAAQHRREHGAQVTFTYEHALKGSAATLTPGAITAGGVVTYPAGSP